MSAEFSRFLTDFLARVGGPSGASTSDLQQIIEDAQESIAALPSLLAQSGKAVRLNGTIAPTVLVSVPIPAQSMGINGMVRVTTTWSMTNSNSEKIVSVRFGGSEISSNAIITATTYHEQRIIQISRSCRF